MEGRRWWIAALAVLAGCDLVYGLDGRRGRDAAPSDAPPDVVDASEVDGPPGEPCLTDVRYQPVSGTRATSTYRYITTTTRTWDVARADCKNDSPTGSHLAVMDDVIELEAIKGAHPQGTMTPWRLWLGYARSHDQTLDQFRSVHDVPLPRSSDLWSANEPDDGGGAGADEPVVLLASDRRLVDAPPTDLIGYLCECDGQPDVATVDLIP